MKEIKEWCTTYRALEETEKLFWAYFESYKKEEPEEFAEVFTDDRNNVRIEFERVDYEVMLPDFDDEFISVYLNIYVDEHSVGWFKNMFLLNGEQFDEYFVIE